jgi:hypothetical protein
MCQLQASIDNQVEFLRYVVAISFRELLSHRTVRSASRLATSRSESPLPVNFASLVAIQWIFLVATMASIAATACCWALGMVCA